METFEVLEKALALIEDETNWHQGGFVGPGGSRCAGQAVIEIMEEQGRCWWEPAWALDAAMSTPGVSLGAFNDTHSHAEVVALFQEAIRAEKAKAGIPVDLPAASPQQEREKATV